MNKKLKIAIYSGSIPSTTFIENLIHGISTKYTVLLFGKQKVKKKYSEKNICCYPTYSNKFQNLIVTKWRLFQLLLFYPKRFKVLFEVLKPKQSWYSKYNWASRFVPVLLHLPDVFHIQWAKDLEHWVFLKEKFGVKIVQSLRGAHINYSPISDPILAASYNENFPKVDAFHAVSDAIGIEAQKYEADASKIKTIHSIIHKNTLDLFRQRIERKHKELRIISVGRHHWIKGYTTALDACRILKDNNVSFSYAIIASGVIPEELIYQRHELELTNEVTFIKGMNQKELFEQIQQIDVLLMSSLKEGIANVVLEAMAIGLPVISTDCGGMNEVVIPGETGRLVPILDSKIMAKALMDLNLASVERLNEITKNAYNLVEKEFDSKMEINAFIDLYEQLKVKS